MMMRESTHKYFITKTYKTEPINEDIPSFLTLLWDNAKTTANYTGGPVLAIALRPFTSQCYGMEEELVWPVGKYIIGPIGAAIFSFPFAISSRFTRQFTTNNIIESYIEKINNFTDTEQKYFIKQIREYDRAFSWGIRSYESAELLSTFGSGLKDFTHTEKWDALKSYLSEKAYDDKSYANNGKKLFNRVLEVATPIIKTNESIKNKELNKATDNIDVDFANNVKNELKKLILILKSTNWQKEGGLSFFCGIHIPKGVAKLKIEILPLENKIDQLSPQSIINIAKELRSINFGKSFSRSSDSKNLYNLVGNLGNNRKNAFDDLLKFGRIDWLTNKPQYEYTSLK